MFPFDKVRNLELKGYLHITLMEKVKAIQHAKEAKVSN